MTVRVILHFGGFIEGLLIGFLLTEAAAQLSSRVSAHMSALIFGL